MWTYTNTYELYHHGILGQKWGVRRFQDKNGRLTNAGKKRYSEDSNKKKENDNQNEKKSLLTDNQKKYIKIGATVAATALVAYGGYKLYQNKDLIAMKAKLGRKNVKFIKDNYDSDKGSFDLSKSKKLTNVEGLGIDLETGLKKFDNSKSTISDLIKGNNPTGSHTNCRANSISMALRMMGFDTSANDIPGGSFSEAINKAFKGAKITEMYSPSKEKIERNILRKYKEGDFGSIASGFDIGGLKMEHAYNWIIENNSVRFFDGQKELDNFSKYLNHINPNKMAEIVKLNGIEINPKGIFEFVSNRA